MAGKRRQPERAEQQALVTWFRLQYPTDLIFAIPNQLIRTEQQAIFAKRIGLVSGMPDLMVAAARKPYHGLFIEMKPASSIKSRVSFVQNRVVTLLQQKGYLAAICYGWDNAAWPRANP